MKLVKFSNGKFGVRRSRIYLPDEYKDLADPQLTCLWWKKTDKDFVHCMSSEEVAREFIKTYEANGIKYSSYLNITDEVIE